MISATRNHICDHKLGRVTTNRRAVDDFVFRSYRCVACGANWRTIEVLATQDALEHAYKLVDRKKRSDFSRRPEAWL